MDDIWFMYSICFAYMHTHVSRLSSMEFLWIFTLISSYLSHIFFQSWTVSFTESAVAEHQSTLFNVIIRNHIYAPKCHVDRIIKIASLQRFPKALTGIHFITNDYRVEFIYIIDLMSNSSVIKNPTNAVWLVLYDKHVCLVSAPRLFPRSLQMYFK